ncbi:MAG: Dyp-type peroxidase [Gemmatimonadaceae bacterium]
MLDLEDIQHFLMMRPHALAARYEFLTFAQATGGRTWLRGLVDRVGTAQGVKAGGDTETKWVTIGFTWNGLRAFGVDDTSLATFPEEFREGMAARAAVLGDVGPNQPSQWVDNLASPALHAIVILFARDTAQRDRSAEAHRSFLQQCDGVKVLSSLDLAALPPLEYSHDHFGYRDRISTPVVEGAGDTPRPGSGTPLKPGEFFLGYPDEEGDGPPLPKPEILSRNGSYVAYRRLQEHVGAFRGFLRQQGETAEEQELVAAKLMGRWRSGAPLALAPEKDDPALGADVQRNNNFGYKDADPYGYAVPLGAHIRRLNPRDTGANMNRRRMIRRGGTYGPPLAEDADDDGVERGVAAFVGCASLVRQFEFAQNVWINDPKFHELENERDPIIGAQDGTLDMTLPKRPVRRRITGLPSFTTLRGGAYFLLPGIRALRFLAAGAKEEG